jgi:hypothetical protein
MLLRGAFVITVYATEGRPLFVQYGVCYTEESMSLLYMYEYITQRSRYYYSTFYTEEPLLLQCMLHRGVLVSIVQLHRRVHVIAVHMYYTDESLLQHLLHRGAFVITVNAKIEDSLLL